MSINIPCYAVKSISHGPGRHLSVELEMDPHQMLATLEDFLANGISDETWSDWQAKINLEIYGTPT